AMYSAELLDHFEHPRNAGDLPEPDVTAEVENPACGDVLRLTCKLVEGRIQAAGFRAKGCVPAMGCSALLTEMVRGMKVEQALELRPEDLVRAIGGLPEASTHAAHLCIDVLRKALKQRQK